ncbi:MAG TPA: hypothetical protein VMZ53_10040 [Kofleriaceae bacterium]|nr:hypothetical protein [Kofleriaceae bacterium]
MTTALVGCAGNGMTGDDMTGDDDGSGGSRPTMDTAVATLAGWAQPGYLDGDRQKNLFNNPTNAVYGPDGKLYVADFDNGKIRVVDMDGKSSTLIAKEGFQRPFGLAFIGSTLYVGTDRDPQGVGGLSDLMSGTIWKVDVTARTATPVATRIGRPRGLCALSDGTLGVTDYAHHVVQVFDPGSGSISPIAGSWDAKGFADGNGASAQFATPYACAQTSDGKLLVTDFDNHRVRLVGLDGSVSTIAGSGSAGFADGSGASAKFNHPQGLVKTSGGFYITDIDNYRVRKISNDLSSISTLAGDGTPGYKDSDDKATAQFYGLEGLTAKADGSLIFVADGTRGEDVPYNRIRLIKN